VSDFFIVATGGKASSRQGLRQGRFAIQQRELDGSGREPAPLGNMLAWLILGACEGYRGPRSCRPRARPPLAAHPHFPAEAAHSVESIVDVDPKTHFGSLFFPSSTGHESRLHVSCVIGKEAYAKIILPSGLDGSRNHRN